jgi:glycosyltransferase involved in cell wall biosynthesis
VYHKGGASFRDSARDLRVRNLAIINSRHPAYARDVERFYRDDPLASARADLAALAAMFRGGPAPTRRRVLHVLHQGGGTEKHARDLARIDTPDVVSYVSTSNGRRLDVDEYFRGSLRRRFRFPLESTIEFNAQRSNPSYRRAFETLCRTLDIDLIHVHHLARNTVDIAAVAFELSLPYVMTLHDYHILCPSYALVDPTGVPCGACIGRPRAAGTAGCMAAIGRDNTYFHAHQSRARVFVTGAARVFAPSQVTKKIVAGVFEELESGIRVIEHGGVPAGPAGPRTRGSGPLNVAVIGGLDPHKGLQPFRRLLRENSRADIVFHLYGWPGHPELSTPLDQIVRVGKSQFVFHGPYESEHVVNMMRAQGIHVGLQLSVWDEAFSYTVSEFAAARIPIIAGDLGAQGERVRRASLGWTVPDPTATADILAVLYQLADEPAFYEKATRAMRVDMALPSLEGMWASYLAEYRGLWEGKVMKTPLENREQGDAGYASFMSQQLAKEPSPAPRTLEELARSQAEVAVLRERLRSPRHRVADAAAGVLHKIPILWPIVAKITDAILRRQRRRQSSS